MGGRGRVRWWLRGVAVAVGVVLWLREARSMGMGIAMMLSKRIKLRVCMRMRRSNGLERWRWWITIS
ncbi:hypothetical protein BDU57DRAFT_524044 [Ampelomyces quisqualis]|uniref:Uncharacterized protein n=1 Tax=Ampelomyces quisqualis TaxID=50730 RepID=A0A6A5Q6P7_AMPQU|nr:hypothetical protein BDU57DRAFT_524044 [Ampelomyces quisqualis]